MFKESLLQGNNAYVHDELKDVRLNSKWLKNS